MALIAMAVYDTDENGRSEYTKRTIESLSKTVNWNKHRLIVVDNGSCDKTSEYLMHLEKASNSDQAFNYTRCNGMKVITLPENIGTAKAVNMGWKLRRPNEHVIKIDNDVVIHQSGWVEDMERAIEYDDHIGIIGLKRKDCWERPTHPSAHYRSELKLLGGDGNKWLVVERVNHVMGTCQMFNSALLDKMGYLYQPRLYGFDDALAAVRCQVAGFKSCFLHGYEIDHIDTGETPYQGWKEKHSMEDMDTYNQLKNAYISGEKSIYSDATW